MCTVDKITNHAANHFGDSTSSTPDELLSNEARTIRRILSGERSLYYDLVAPYERLIYLSALSVLRNEAEAEDCAQEALLKAFQNLGEFKGRSKISSWLVRITFNEAKMRLRKFRPGLHEPIDTSGAWEGQFTPQYLWDSRETPSEVMERKQAQELLHKAVKRLPDMYREVFVLREIRNRSIATTAQLLGVSDGVVKTRLGRARMQLRGLLAPFLENSIVLSRQVFGRRTAGRSL
jgi:RNA polymerase sigma-70 factor (ECF subfamily)